MALVLLAHIGIPLVFGVGFLLLAYMTGPEEALGSELAVEAALDLSILSIGATAAILENPKLQALFHEPGSVIVTGMSIAAMNFLLTVLIILMRRSVYRKASSIKKKRFCASLALVCGLFTVISICLPVVYAFEHPNLVSAVGYKSVETLSPAEQLLAPKRIFPTVKLGAGYGH